MHSGAASASIAPDKEDVQLSAVEAIQHVVTRSFIPHGQMALYHALCKAGDDRLFKTELADRIRDRDISARAIVMTEKTLRQRSRDD